MLCAWISILRTSIGSLPRRSLGAGSGGHCESFDVKIKQTAMFWESAQRARPWTMDPELLDAAGGVEALRCAVGAEAIPEASDKYATCSKSDDIIINNRGDNARVWVDVVRRANILARLRSCSTER
jgi:hypothetical protein